MMSKRKQNIEQLIDRERVYSVSEAFAVLQKASTVKFTESIDVAINLGVDPRKSDQVVRGATVLPHGTGKTVKVAVLAPEDKHEIAKNAGADKVGFDDLIESIQRGEIDFDVLISTPDAMPKIGKLGQILGPKGLMPNPKVGTVSADVATAVTNAKAGQVQFRTDKNGIIHSTLGKINFSAQAIEENLQALTDELKKLKPSSAKGSYVKKATLSSTMGPGLAIDVA